MERIVNTELGVIREPLRAPFGFKGGTLSELWQTAVRLTLDSGASGMGVGVQSVLWSDPVTFCACDEAGGNERMLAVTRRALELLQGQAFTDPPGMTAGLVPELLAFARRLLGRADVPQTFVLNALVPVDFALWQLWNAKRGNGTFDALCASFCPELPNREKELGSIPLITYHTPEDELPAGSRAELLAWLLALQTDDGDSAMFSTFFARRSERIREDIDAFLSAEEGKYVKLLTSVRELYKSRALRIEQNGFYVISTNRQFDPFATTELSATATDARVVLLTSGSGAPEVSQADMPVLKNVECRGAKALDGLAPEHAYDVGVVLTTDGGVPALLYRRSGGEIVVRELSAEQYVDILVSGGRPLINVDTLPAPAQELSGSECKILPLN